MNDRDRDLIIDLVENRLGQPDAQAALLRVKADPELAAEYDQQVALKSALASEPLVAMTSEEQASLRQNLVAQLHLDEAPVVAPIRTQKRVWWIPALGLGAAALAVTAFVVLPGTFGSTDQAAFDTAALTEITVATTTMAAAAADANPPQDGTSNFQGESDAGAMESPVAVPEVAGEAVPDLLTATAGDKTPEEVDEAVAPLGLRSGPVVDSDAVDVCLEQLRDKLPPETTGAIILGADTSGPSTIVHVGLTFADGIQAGVSIDLADCSIAVYDG